MADQKRSTGHDAGQAEMQKRTDEAEKKGFLGIEVDPTPNENYSMEKPDEWRTPETDPGMAAKAGSAKFQHLKEGDDA
jgi:hypothetical protein